MPIDQSLVGRAFPPTSPHEVTEERVRAFAESVGGRWEPGDAVPATYPIVLAFEAMSAFLDAEQVELHRIVHGEQKFAYERALAPGDRLTAALTVSSLRQIGGNDIIGTTSEVTDADGGLVCTTSATLVHRGGDEGGDR
jgi:acyl dehydratase